MSDSMSVTLEKTTYKALEARATGFGVNIDDVIMELIAQNETLKEQIERSDAQLESQNTHSFGSYVIHKLPKGKILVTEDGVKVSNMKKILIDAGNDAGVPEKDLDPNFTTYEIGRHLFRYLDSSA